MDAMIVAQPIDEPGEIERPVFDRASHLRKLEEFESRALKNENLDIPVIHRFSKGVYVREVEMPAGIFVMGHEHKTRHFNIILSGRALVSMDGVVSEVKAGDVIESTEGVRKLLLIEETMRWLTVHANPSDETDTDVLMDSHIVKSNAFKDFEAQKSLLLQTSQNQKLCRTSQSQES